MPIKHTLGGEESENEFLYNLSKKLLHALELVLPVMPGSLEDEFILQNAVQVALKNEIEIFNHEYKDCNCGCKLCVMSTHEL